MLRERNVGLAKLRVSSPFSTGSTAGTLLRVPSPNRGLDAATRDGSTSVGRTRLRLVLRGGDYLIDGEW